MPNPAGDSHDEDVEGEIASQTLREFEALVADLSQPKYVFRLYVAGNSNRSRQAITNVREICERYLAGNYELDVVDVYQQPEVTKHADVIALPTLIKELPFPPKKFVGDMSDTERIVVGLKLRS
ncbi:circadian clock KaiB family protein [Terriglobus sp. TAA 43]|uniref:circadian clock KaiB family protein n=1 Tax=Terriglobus sp. TAA 43 TaxID=278961 RepID=UPI000A0597CB|nr:circadian clock KaiB family protein [Terriglobus sp. TAA 43]